MSVTVGCPTCGLSVVRLNMAWRCPKCGRRIERAAPRPGDPANLQRGRRLLSDEELGRLLGMDVRGGKINPGR